MAIHSASRFSKHLSALSLIVVLNSSFSFSQNDSTIDTLSKKNTDELTILTDSSQVVKADSVASIVLDTVRSLLKTNDSLFQIDSIRKLTLIEQLEKVVPNDTKKKKRIEERIDSITRSDSIRRSKQSTEISRLRNNLTGYPVLLGHDTLFLIYTKFGPFTAQERAGAISKRLSDIARIVGFNPDTLLIFTNEASSDIMYSEKTILSITDKDALFHESTSDSIAQQYMVTIKKAILEYRKNRSLVHYAIQSGQIFGILVLAILGIFLIRRLFTVFRKYIDKNSSRFIKGLHIKTVSLVSKEMQYKTTFQALRLIEFCVYIVIGFITLPFIFNVFPATKQISSILLDWTLSPVKNLFSAIIHYLPNVFNILVIIIVSQLVIKLLKKIFEEIEKGTLKFHGFYEEWARPTFNIAKFLVYVLTFVMIFPYLPGSDSPIFKGVSVFLGLLFSLGSTSAISNIVAGLVITYMRPFKIGDRIKIGEVIGDVLEKNMLVTRLQTIKNEIITMPNSTILSGHTINYSTNGKDAQLLLHTSVSIGYDVPWRTVHKLLIDGISANSEPFVLQKSLDDFYVSYELNAYTTSPQKMASIYSLLHQNIQDRFNDAHVEILSPHYRAVRNGNKQTFSDTTHDSIDRKE
jgi:small-conductance mechanosensitive channel